MDFDFNFGFIMSVAWNRSRIHRHQTYVYERIQGEKTYSTSFVAFMHMRVLYVAKSNIYNIFTLHVKFPYQLTN